jgi:hypothetical protein
MLHKILTNFIDNENFNLCQSLQNLLRQIPENFMSEVPACISQQTFYKSMLTNEFVWIFKQTWSHRIFKNGILHMRLSYYPQHMSHRTINFQLSTNPDKNY